LDPDAAAVGFDDAAGDAEAQAAAAAFGAEAGGFAAVEGIEHVGQVAFGDAFAGIANFDLDAIGQGDGAEGDRAIRRGVADRVLEKVVEHAR
jgi:hypothetical protein